MTSTTPALTATTAATAATATKPATNALTTLAGNFNDFLGLLMTQLKNQDPTSPMDTNQFTSQIVQFTSVEQQINTNANLTQLIAATQGNTLLQSSALVGQSVEVSGGQLSLQNGTAGVRLQATAPGPVTIGVFSPSGAKLRETTIAATAGTNDWTWDGKDTAGQSLPDGPYKVVVQDPAGTAIPFTTTATATGIERSTNGMKVDLGALQVDLANIQSVGPKP